MRVPNCERAVVDPGKLQDYCLSPTHPRGRHKARLFAASLGLTQADADELHRTLLSVACNDTAVTGELDAYGQRYVLDFAMSTQSGHATIRSAWIVRSDEDFPRLLTCYVL